jgi:hypothetical protein
MRKVLHLFVFCTLIAFTGAVFAQTPDGQTPAEEMVCDPLQADGVSKGLYGLCVAFCEAHDAASVDEPMTEDQLSDILVLSPNGRILTNYNKKKNKANNPADPDMPCVRVEEPCPCWTADETATIDGFASDGSALTVIVSAGDYAVCQEVGYDSSGVYELNQFVSWDDIFGPDSGICQSFTTTGIHNSVTLFYYGEGDSNNMLTQEQLDACTAQVLDCVDRNTP